MGVRLAAFLGCVICFSACSTPERTPRAIQPGLAAPINDDVTRFATGPLANACLVSDRRRADPSLCGCVQAAADVTLSQGQQQRAVRFFSEPELLESIRVSDTPENERFWDAWSGFADRARSLCQTT